MTTLTWLWLYGGLAIDLILLVTLAIVLVRGNKNGRD